MIMSTTEKRLEGIEPISKDSYDDIFVQELEERLETDPLMTNGLVDLAFQNDPNAESADLLCWFCEVELNCFYNV